MAASLEIAALASDWGGGTVTDTACGIELLPEGIRFGVPCLTNPLILGVGLIGSEGAKQWATMLTGLRNRTAPIVAAVEAQVGAFRDNWAGPPQPLRSRPIPMLRVPDVLDRVGVSRRTLCRWRADGTFPQALRLDANSIGWPCHVVDEWLANRPPFTLASDAPASPA